MKYVSYISSSLWTKVNVVEACYILLLCEAGKLLRSIKLKYLNDSVTLSEQLKREFERQNIVCYSSEFLF
jgi:hypothetical protein